MLGKLIKQEWKAVWKILGAINIFMPCLTLVGALGFLIFSQFTISEFASAMLVGIYIATFALTAFAVTIGVMIYLGIRYYRSMYGSEGYLTHTLPATPLQLIVSKLIVAVLWYLITIILMIVSILALLFCINASLGFPVSMVDVARGFGFMGREFYQIGISPAVFCTSYILLLVLGTVFGIMMMYGAAALGQLFDRYRILSSVGIYFGFTIIIQALSFIISMPVALTAGHQSNTASIYTMFNVLVFGMFILVTVGLFVMTYFLTKKKLNLE